MLPDRTVDSLQNKSKTKKIKMFALLLWFLVWLNKRRKEQEEEETVTEHDI